MLAYLRLTGILLGSVRGTCRSSDSARLSAHLYLVAALTQFAATSGKQSTNTSREGSGTSRDGRVERVTQNPKESTTRVPMTGGPGVPQSEVFQPIALEPALLAHLCNTFRVLPDEIVALDAMRDRDRVAQMQQRPQQTAQRGPQSESPLRKGEWPSLLFGGFEDTSSNADNVLPLTPPL